VAGDKGYSFPSLRRYLRRRGIRAVIPCKSDQPHQRSFDKAAYRERNQVERTINKLKGWRRYRRNLWMSPWHENAAYLPS
jgi:transposase